MYTIAQSPMLTSYAQTQQPSYVHEAASSMCTGIDHCVVPNLCTRRRVDALPLSPERTEQRRVARDDAVTMARGRLPVLRGLSATSNVVRKAIVHHRSPPERDGGFSRLDDRPCEVRQIRQIDTAQFPSPRTARLMNVLVSPCCKKRNRDFGFSPMVASSSSSVGQSTLVSNLLVARSSQLWLSRHPQWGVHGRIEALVMIVRNGHAAGKANAAGALRHLAIAIRAVGGIEALVTIVRKHGDAANKAAIRAAGGIGAIL